MAHPSALKIFWLRKPRQRKDDLTPGHTPSKERNQEAQD